MELDVAIRRRRMCRSYSDEPLDTEVVDRLLDAARRAPSAGHSQGWSFVVLSGPEETGRFWDAVTDEEWRADPSLPSLMKAPVVIVPLCSPAVYVARYSEPDKVAHNLTSADAWPVAYWTVDVSFGTMLLMLAVVQEGLGALFFGLQAGREEELRAAFGIPGDWQPIGAITVGRPSEDWGPRGSASRGRKPLGEIVHRGGW
jgi:nitroreductase